MKNKLLVAGIALASSMQASASILGSYDTANDGLGLAETIFAIWDPVTQNSYSQDLGVTFGEFVANAYNPNYSLSFAIDQTVWDAAFTATGANPANLIWNIGVAEHLANDFHNFENYGVFTTHGDAAPFFNGLGALAAIQNEDIFSTTQDGAFPSEGQSNNATNRAYHGTNNNGAYAGTGRTWGINFAGAAPINNTAHIGDTLSYWYVRHDLFTDIPVITETAGDWTFDGQTLTYGSQVSAVPVPAAAWLMASGLIGLVGVARRKAA